MATQIYEKLAAIAALNWVARMLAYFAAGWLSLVGVVPDLAVKKPLLKLRYVFGAAILMGGFFVVVGPLLSTLLPMVEAAGLLNLSTAIWSFIVLLNIYRFKKGRSLIKGLRHA